MKLSIILLPLLLTGARLAAEIPPFYPELPPPAPYNTTIPANEVKAALPGGGDAKPGTFLSVRSLNGDWKFSGLARSARPFDDAVDLDKGYQAAEFDDSGWGTIPVPLDWYRHDPKGYLREEPYVKGFYRKTFELSDAELAGKRVLLRFGVIGYDGTVFVNGREAGRHRGDFTPCEFDITPLVHPGKNTVAIRVLTDFGTTHGAVPLAKHVYGSQWGWGNIKGGLWQPVELRFVPEVYFDRMLVSPKLADNSIRIDYSIVNATGKPRSADLAFSVTTALRSEPNRPAGTLDAGKIELRPGLNTGTATLKLDHPRKWSPEHPFLYYLSGMLMENGKPFSGGVERFGFRDFRIVNGKFHLNGERLYLFGENIRSVDFGGRGTTPEEDRDNFAKALTGFKRNGVNMIRNAHLPILPAALEIADEIGLMIYDEWGWSFTNRIDEPIFQRNNDRELREFIRRDYNHPSVVMWSGANEVVHRDNPPVKRQLDRQIDTFRAEDHSGRPAGSFSGSASWSSYGTDPLNTDFLDLHSYYGLGSGSWTLWNRQLDTMYDNSLKHYNAKGNLLPFPYIIWECVGFSWGNRSDASFRTDDIRRYADYARGGTSWAQGNGIGYAGTIGLAAALDPRRGMDYGKALFGHRLLELARQNPRVDGFAPWQHAHSLQAAALWNQPVLAGVRNTAGLPSSNLFAGSAPEWELFAVNSTNHPRTGLSARLWLVTEDGREFPLGEYRMPDAAPWQTAVLQVTPKLPAEPLGHVQLRLLLTGSDGKELSRNFYPLFLQDPAVMTAPVAAKGDIALLDLGEPGAIERTGAILKALGVPFRVIVPDKLDKSFRLAILPAGEKRELKPELISEYLKNGGNVLALEQRGASGSLLPQSRPTRSPASFVDLVLVSHPIFRGLDQRNFDLWENPDGGMVITDSLAPFNTNAIAVRGPFLGAQNVENAITEARVGKGRILWSQLDAVGLWGRDSAATTYLRNLIDYMASGAPVYGKVQPLELVSGLSWEIPADREIMLDLSKQANRPFSDDGKNGGWTGQGENDFRNMPLGIQKVNGVNFNIIDPAKNNGKSCLVLRGTPKPDFPARIDGIPVGEKLARLFFLHACAWSGKEAGRYRLNYEDGTHADYILYPGRNIGDWWTCSFLSDAAPGILRQNALGQQVGVYMAVWENPHPEKTIRTIDVLSSGAENDIDFLPGKSPVPIVVAITAERANPEPIPVSAKWAGGGRDDAPAPKIEQIRMPGPGGSEQPIVRIRFPEVSGIGFSYAMVRFDPAKLDLKKYRYLVMWVKAPRSGSLDINIPETNWRGRLRGSLDLDSTFRTWRKVRIDLMRTMNGKSMIGKPFRGELFLYNGENKAHHFPRPAVTVELTGIQFE